jgi:two-component system sensor histidine kinase KdpD
MSNLSSHSKGIIGYLIAFAGVCLITLVLFPFESHINHTTISLALLLVVLVIATIFGSRPALFASFIGVLSFNFLFLHPVYTFTIDDPQNWVAFASFFVTAAIAGQLSSYARRRAKESEERRREIERLYNELQAAFEQASQAEALRRSEQLKSSLLDAVTHDLRTPLTSIKASVTTLIQDQKNNFKKQISQNGDYLPLDDEARDEFLEIINEETDRLNQFIEGIVGIAKVEAGALHLRKSWNQAEEIIDNAIDRAKNRLSKHRILIEIAPELPVVFVDAHSISEVVYTLLENAAKYSPENSKIRVSARFRGDKSIEISVEDEGRGVSKEMRGKIFEKFFRANDGDIHTTSSGLGLGLAIARGIVESQNGKIWIEDGRGEYKTKAVFTVPVGGDEK